MEPGLTTTWPRSTSSRFRPRSSRPQFSPAHASSSCLWKHLDTGNRGLLDRADADDLDLGVDGEGSTLGAARNNGATASDREDVFDRHQERLVAVTYGVRNGLVDSSHQVLNGLDPLGVAFQGLQA